MTSLAPSRPGLRPTSSAALAREITRRASRQSYSIIRWLVDRGRADDAFRAYAYFRWVDDIVDVAPPDRPAHLQFLAHQRQLIGKLLTGTVPDNLLPEEQMLADLIASRRDQHPGLGSYIDNMMAVMEFDADRRGRLITQAELERYTSLLATAVWDCIEYFIGHAHCYPDGPARTQAAAGAHIVHLLRDTEADLAASYFSVPREVLEAHKLTPADTRHPAYRDWVRQRVELARQCFVEGKRYLRKAGCLRGALTGWLYIARFEPVLRQIEADDYYLRATYPAPFPLLAALTGAPRAPLVTAGRTKRTQPGGAG